VGNLGHDVLVILEGVSGSLLALLLSQQRQRLLRTCTQQVPILPSNQSPLGALPARFRRERLLIVGHGDVGGVARLLSLQAVAGTAFGAGLEPQLRSGRATACPAREALWGSG
jgi:hypothetical protein